MKRSETIKRDTAFMKVCMQTSLQLSSGRFTPSVEVIVEASLRKPAPAYYTTFSLAMKNLTMLLQHGTTSGQRLSGRKKMWFELLEKVRSHNGITPDGRIKPHALSIALYRTGASSFFISKSYALRLYQSINSQHKKKLCNCQSPQNQF